MQHIFLGSANLSPILSVVVVCSPVGLKGLRKLQLGGNQLTSLAALRGLGQLQDLSAEYNRLKDSRGVEVSVQGAATCQLVNLQ